MREVVKKKLAIWGYGSHTRRNVIPAASQCTSIELSVVCSRQRLGTIVQNTANQDIRCVDVDELLCGDADLIYVCTPTGLHYEHCRMALLRGKNVLCEKSLTNDAKHSVELLSLAKEKGLFLSEAFMYCFHPRTIEARRIVRAGELGSIRSITCEFGIPKLEEPGFRNDHTLGGSAFWDLACYLVSLVNELMPNIPEVVGTVTQDPARSTTGVDLGGAALLRFAPGIPAFLNWGYETTYRNRLEIWGDRGSLRVDRIFSKGGPPEFIERVDSSGRVSQVGTKSADAFVNMLDHIGSNLGSSDFRDAAWRTASRQALVMHSIWEKMYSNRGT